MSSVTRGNRHIARLDAGTVVDSCDDFDRASERIAVSIIKLIGWIGVVFLTVYGLRTLIENGLG
jgi:hypothetical protein